MKDWKQDMIKQWGGWYSKAFVEDWNKACRDIDYKLLFGESIEDKEENQDMNLKFAYVYRDNSKILAYVDNENGDAYEVTDKYEKGNKIDEYTFDRWCRSMDL